MLSKRGTTKVVKRIESELGVGLGKQKSAKVIEVDESRKIISVSNYIFVEISNMIAPFLNEEELVGKLPFVVVDKGAIPHICNGAKVMRPGIVDFPNEFNKGELVAIKEEIHGKFIAIGRALCSSNEAKKMDKGVVLENIHYVGDKLWEVYKEVKRKL